jgi:hypothetical protein
MAKIETIFTHTADSGIEGELGIDESGRLYWNKKLVITKSKITLDWWVNLSVILASISTVIMAAYAIASYYKDLCCC